MIRKFLTVFGKQSGKPASFTFLVGSGFFLAYLVFFIKPIFFDATTMQFLPYIPRLNPIGIDLQQMLSYSDSWFVGKNTPYIGANLYPPLATVLVTPLLYVKFFAAYKIITLLTLSSFCFSTYLLLFRTGDTLPQALPALLQQQLRAQLVFLDAPEQVGVARLQRVEVVAVAANVPEVHIEDLLAATEIADRVQNLHLRILQHFADRALAEVQAVIGAGRDVDEAPESIDTAEHRFDPAKALPLPARSIRRDSVARAGALRSSAVGGTDSDS